MSNEITVQCSLQIKNGNLTYQSQPTGYKADMSAVGGPSPGMVIVPTTGKDIYFSELTTPGFCRMMNLDPTNYVEVGVKDPQTDVFYPVLILRPGRPTVVELTPNFGEQYSGSGTGTTTPENYLRLKANVASCKVLVEAFES